MSDIKRVGILTGWHVVNDDDDDHDDACLILKGWHLVQHIDHPDNDQYVDDDHGCLIHLDRLGRGTASFFLQQRADLQTSASNWSP